MSKIFTYDQLRESDLVVGATYEWGPTNSTAHEPLKELLSIRSTGGFRPRKKTGGKTWEYAFVVLYSTGSKKEWPDNLDLERGLFTYYGDNKKTTDEWRNTLGNRILDYAFRMTQSSENRRKLYPFFIFTIVPNQRHARFMGVAVPGHPSISSDEELEIVEMPVGAGRFYNYKGVFSILNIPVVGRAFIEELLNGDLLGVEAPNAWKDWVENDEYDLLPTLQIIPRRTKITPVASDSEEEESLSEELIISRIKKLDSKESGDPKIRHHESKQFARSPELAKLIRTRVGDACQICGDIYHSEKGAYCDTHHVIPLKKGGMDTSDNIMVVCPNCHRKFHLTDVELVDRGISKSVIIPWADGNEEIEYWRDTS